MENDSEEKILRDWNKMYEPSPFLKMFPELEGSGVGLGNQHQETDFRNIYRNLKEYAQRHGKQGIMPSREVNVAQDLSFRTQLKGNHKEIMNLWIRAKNLRKLKKNKDAKN